VAQEQGKLADAEKFYREALIIQEGLGSAAGMCEALNNLGTVSATQGRWGEAANLYQQALGYARSLPPGALLALTLMHQGDVARRQRNFPQALDFYQQALALDTAKRNREGQAVRWTRLGRVYLDMSDYSSARRYLLMGLEESRRLERTGAIIDALDGLVNLGVAQGDRFEAQLYGERLLKIYQIRGQTRDAERLAALLKKSAK
jgi:tetratricopeptide (TPR) repeat protein